jgi:outer membrane PBP1 activator LpoA protein
LIRIFLNLLIVIYVNLVNSNTIFQILRKDKLDLLKLNIDILTKLGKTDEAQTLINKLISDNEDTNLEDDILIMNSDLAFKSGDIKKAVNLLKKVSIKDENIFKSSRIKLADIYLTQLMERRLYNWCYIEILDNVTSY